MSTFLHYVRCKDAPLDCSTPGGEKCESLTGVDEIDKDDLEAVSIYLMIPVSQCRNSHFKDCLIFVMGIHISDKDSPSTESLPTSSLLVALKLYKALTTLLLGAGSAILSCHGDGNHGNLTSAINEKQCHYHTCLDHVITCYAGNSNIRHKLGQCRDASWCPGWWAAIIIITIVIFNNNNSCHFWGAIHKLNAKKWYKKNQFQHSSIMLWYMVLRNRGVMINQYIEKSHSEC